MLNLHEAVGRFFTPDGEIALPDELTMPGLCEMLYQMEAAAGDGDRKVVRYWDYTKSREGEAIDLTRTQMNTRIKVVAARLQQIAKPTDRVAILMGNSPDYVTSFLGAMYAVMTPVPLYDPMEPGHADHLQAVLADCTPSVVLTNSASAAAVRRIFAAVPAAERPRILSVDALPDSLAASWVNPLQTEAGQKMMAELQAAGKKPVDLLAFLQYTSGSTRTPAGVLLTHRAVLANALQIFVVAQFKNPPRMVSWLPMHHDMGIILAAMFTILGMPMDIMRPRDFVQQPSRWLEQLSRRADEDYSYTAVPNFALDLAVRYGQPKEGETLDLSCVDNLILGAEAATVASLDRFEKAFAPYGFKREMFRPSYGLAESSLLLTTPKDTNRPCLVWMDREALSEGRIEKLDGPGPKAASIVQVGAAIPSVRVIIVDPETRMELPDGQVGEVWGYGENIAAGYFGRPEETAAVFHNKLAGRKENSRAAGVPEDALWLATGDLGSFVDDQLCLTGRTKELIIIAGRNHYPRDIEATAAEATSHIHPLAIAAFAVPGDDVEKLVIIAERDIEADPAGDGAAVEAIRTAVSAAHGVSPADIFITGPDEIARSSSSKIARRVCRAHYLADHS